MKDKLKIGVAVAVFTVGVIGYYFSIPLGGLGQIASLVLGVLLGAGIYITTAQFAQFRRFVRESRAELGKVVWPERQETLQNTAVVIAMVLFVGAFLWLVDWILFTTVRYIMG